jgi:hypothetical protein
MVFRMASWHRHHPLLAQMYKLKHAPEDDDADFDTKVLGEAIARQYLPPERSEPLLGRLTDAERRLTTFLPPDDDA